MTLENTFECKCIAVKSHRLVFDGGSSGKYVAKLCHECYGLEDKRFLISEIHVDDFFLSESDLEVQK